MENSRTSKSHILNYIVPAQSRPGPAAWDVVGGTIASIIALAAFFGAAAFLASCCAAFLGHRFVFTDFTTGSEMFGACVVCGLLAVRSAKARFRGCPEAVWPPYPLHIMVLESHDSRFIREIARLFSILGGVLLSAVVVLLLSLLFRRDWNVAPDVVYWLLVATLATMAFGVFRTAFALREPDRLNL